MATHHDEELSKVERKRLEREERIAASKTSSGKKKAIKTGSKAKVVWSVLAVLLVLALVCWYLVGIGLPQKKLVAMTVGDARVSPAEYNYYFHNQKSSLARYLGMRDPAQLDMSQAAEFADEEMSRAEYVKKETLDQIRRIEIESALAAADGYELDDEDRAAIEEGIASLRGTERSEAEFEANLQQVYGKGVDIPLLRKIFEKEVLAGKYRREKPATYEFTDDEIEAEYEKSKDDIDLVDYRMLQLYVAPVATGEAAATDASEATDEAVTTPAETTSGSNETATETSDAAGTEATSDSAAEATSADATTEAGTSEDETTSAREEATFKTPEIATFSNEETTPAEPSEADKAAALEATRTLADRMMRELKDGKSFEALAADFPDDELGLVSKSARDADPEGDYTLYRARNKAQIYPRDLADWLTDAQRKAGEYATIEFDGNVYVLQFLKKGPDLRKTASVSVRRWTADGLSEDERLAAVEALKDELAAIDGVAAFEAFEPKAGNLGDAFTVDGVNLDSPLPREVIDAVLDGTDAETKVGVYEVQNTVLLYLVKERGERPAYQQELLDKMRAAKYTEELDAVLEGEDHPIEENPFGMMFVTKG